MAVAQQWQTARRSTDRQMDVIREGHVLVHRDVVTNAVNQVDGSTPAGHFGGSRDHRFGIRVRIAQDPNGCPLNQRAFSSGLAKALKIRESGT